jgi:16S rRNA (cytidine1402-2'-O)-methyltransferase
MSTLYVVGTPIGNLEDITLRALRVLKEVDVILCEDTRVTKRLLQKYAITTKTMSYHARSGLAKTEKILGLLTKEKNLALVSDSGMPTISDPGVMLVAAVRKTHENDVAIVSIPGPSAATSALSISGLPASQFLFLGFLPHKKGRETLFGEITSSKRTTVFFESPHRIQRTLEKLVAALDTTRHVIVARELTKIHEEVVSGMAEEVLHFFHANPEKVRGEFVVLVSGVAK